MTRINKYFPVTDLKVFRSKLVHWLARHEYFSYFDGNGYPYPDHPFKSFAAAGAMGTFEGFSQDPFEELKEFYEQRKDWIIGRFNYDLKNQIERLSSLNPDHIHFSDISFFIPETLIFFGRFGVDIHDMYDPDKIFADIAGSGPANYDFPCPDLQCDTNRQEYVKNVQKIRSDIEEGSFYELNYCIEYYAENYKTDPAALFLKLMDISPMPFSVFQGQGGHFILSASPERFMKKTGDQLIIQPIKGTIRRDPDPVKDRMLINKLRNSEKEVAENMMIVDLTRNDLARSSRSGSVSVPEMFGIYSFSHLHQMISTVSARLSAGVHGIDALKNAFPMGSMTGAPKIRVMQAIELYENSRRGSFSGAAGYFTPAGDFDFNVLIRTIFYNAQMELLKFNVGSAITYDADPESEYEECILKARALNEALGIDYSLRYD